MKKTKPRRDLDEYIFFVFHLYSLFDLDDLSIFPLDLFCAIRSFFFFFFFNNVRFFCRVFSPRASKSNGFSVHSHFEFYTSSREYFSQSRSFASFFVFFFLSNAHSPTYCFDKFNTPPLGTN